ncbi:lysM domain-containing GPI-anchored protein 2 isoform X2 [Silene latifolia]|uniref:lysM domain-containing GPI-anchored protein 2 isoform X2 n=1 Tax=Silene latifolia TaxID=37657 RepID=UPI003D781A27
MTKTPLHHLLTLTLLTTLLTQSTSQPAPSFKCSSTSTCKSLVGYISPNTTTLSHIQSLFQVKTLRTILGVNNLPPTTPPNHTVPANSTVKIPFPCRCVNGTGLSNKVPQYKIVKDDGLSHIAMQVFSGLVTYQQIQAANGIKDANLIIVGHELWIPLPCSCDDVDGEKVVHYGHVVAAGSSVEQIAEDFGTTSATLLTVNGIKDPKDLIAGQVLDVPLRACSASVSPTSFDYPLLVPTGTYVDTAHNCVMCKCDATNNFTLQCEPSGLKAVDWHTCPSMKCAASDLSLGNFTDSPSCSRTTCAYAGFNKNQTIFTTLAQSNTCPGNATDDSSLGLKIHSMGWSIGSGLLLIQLLMLHRFL